MCGQREKELVAGTQTIPEENRTDTRRERAKVGQRIVHEWNPADTEGMFVERGRKRNR